MNTIKFDDGTELTASDFTVAIVVGVGLAAVTTTAYIMATRVSEWCQNRRVRNAEKGNPK